MRCQEVVSVWDKIINSWISEVKQYEEKMAKEQSQNERGEYQIDELWNLNFERVKFGLW